MNPKFSYLKRWEIFLVKIQESDNMKLKYRDQEHMIMKMQHLNMGVKNNLAMDLAQNHN